MSKYEEINLILYSNFTIKNSNYGRMLDLKHAKHVATRTVGQGSGYCIEGKAFRTPILLDVVAWLWRQNCVMESPVECLTTQRVLVSVYMWFPLLVTMFMSCIQTSGVILALLPLFRVESQGGIPQPRTATVIYY